MNSSLVIVPYSIPMSQIRLSLNLSCNVFKSSLWPAHKVGQNVSGLSSVISTISYKACLPLVSSSETLKACHRQSLASFEELTGSLQS